LPWPAGVQRPLLLDIGSGAGRIGHTFVAAGDNYIGVDLSFEILRAFLVARLGWRLAASPAFYVGPTVRICLSRRTFDAVMIDPVFRRHSVFRLLVRRSPARFLPAAGTVGSRPTPHPSTA